MRNREKIRMQYQEKKARQGGKKAAVQRPFKSLEFVPLKVIRPDKRRSFANPPDTTLKELAQDLFPSIMDVF